MRYELSATGSDLLYENSKTADFEDPEWEQNPPRGFGFLDPCLVVLQYISNCESITYEELLEAPDPIPMFVSGQWRKIVDNGYIIPVGSLYRD